LTKEAPKSKMPLLGKIGVAILISGMLTIATGSFRSISENTCDENIPPILPTLCNIDFIFPVIVWYGIGGGLFALAVVIMILGVPKEEVEKLQESQSKLEQSTRTNPKQEFLRSGNALTLSIFLSIAALFAIPIKEIQEPLKTIIFIVLFVPAYAIIGYQVYRYFRGRQEKRKENGVKQ
jgi:hypothetical protein